MEKIKLTKSLRFKLSIITLLASLIISVFFGWSIYYTASSLFFDYYLKSHQSLGRSMADAIDGDKHAAMATIENNNEIYDEYFTLLANLKKREPFITWLYTLHLIPETNELVYVVDTTTMHFDTIWIESNEFSFYYQIDKQGNALVVYNDQVYRKSFRFPVANKPKVEFDSQSLSIAGQAIFSVKNQSPLQIQFGLEILDSNSSDLEEPIPLKIGTNIIYLFPSFTDQGEPASNPGAPYIESLENSEFIKELLNQNKDYMDTEVSLGSYGEELSFFNVIRNKKGKATGMLLMDVSNRDITKFNHEILVIAIFMAALIQILFLVLALLLGNYLIYPIRQMLRSVDRITQGHLEERLVVKRSDEFGLLAQNFNQMTRYLQTAYEKLQATNISFSRFVPMEFLEYLNKQDVISVEMGDNTQENLTIYFSDIRSFTSLSENMTPKENFDFLNSWLSQIVPVIRHHSGFIDKFIGDAVMALFPGSVEHALDTAIESTNKLKIFNLERIQNGSTPIEIGIGLHYGSVMMGIIGANKRLDVTVISDTVNMASRLEGLTKIWGARIIISGSTRDLIKKPSTYNFRYLDRVQIRGKWGLTDIYEIIVPQISAVDQMKLQYIDDFYFACSLFHDKKTTEAYQLFEKLKKINPDDKAIDLYIERIEKK